MLLLPVLRAEINEAILASTLTSLKGERALDLEDPWTSDLASISLLREGGAISRLQEDILSGSDDFCSEIAGSASLSLLLKIAFIFPRKIRIILMLLGNFFTSYDKFKG